MVGDYNLFEPRSRVGEGARISSFCVVGCGCCILAGEELPQSTVVYGAGQTRYIQSKQVQVSNILSVSRLLRWADYSNTDSTIRLQIILHGES